MGFKARTTNQRASGELAIDVAEVADAGDAAGPSGGSSGDAADILGMLDGKWTDTTRPKALYDHYIAACPEAYVALILAGLEHPEQRVRNGCAELASLLSAERPALLYRGVDGFIDHLASKQAILRWEAACTLGNLAVVDTAAKIPAQLPALFEFLSNKSIVLQGHAVRALSKIAAVYPDHAADILGNLLRASANFPGNRVGFIVEAMEVFLHMPELTTPARRFVDDHAHSPIKSVATKARRVSKRAPAA